MPSVCALLLLLFLPLAAAAQGMDGLPQLSAGEIASARAACEELGRMPNAPMSVESCKAMLDLAAQLNAATNDPSARRPGDDAMTCAAIFAELQTLAGTGISEASRARAEAVVADGTALARRQAGELNAFIVESYALGAAAGAVSAFTPNFVGAALAAAWQAQMLGLAASQAAAQAPLRAQMNDVMLAGIGELGQSLQANPRFARLMQLALDKGCEPPASAAR